MAADKCDWICQNPEYLITQEVKSSLWLNMKATLHGQHYQDTPMTGLKIARSAITGSIFLTLPIHDSPLWGIWCHWGALIRMHVVSSCCQRLSWPDKYTVAVFLLY